MNWFQELFFTHSAVQAVVVLSVIIAVGLGLGKLKIFGVSLGVAFVFFSGILAGHLGLSIDPSMLKWAENFGLVLFVYELGLKVGPGFFSSFRSGGIRLNMMGLGLILLGSAMSVGLSYACAVPMSDMAGILCGATTNTPALGAAQQALQQLGVDGNGAALSCAVTYPLGVVGVIIALVVMRKLVARPTELVSHTHDTDHTYVGEFEVDNPALNGRSIKEIRALSGLNFVISRLWRDGKVSIPGPDVRLAAGDHILVVSKDSDIDSLTMIFGRRLEKDWNDSRIDWDAVDKSLVSKKVVISRPNLNGKKLGALKLRNQYHVNISRVSRAGTKLLATPGLVLQLGDRVTIVGEQDSVDQVARLLGNSVSDLKDPNLAAIFIGMVVGLIVGSIPIMLPGISVPVKLGLAGGPIVIGILMGRFGPQMHLVTYTTRSANLMLRGIGLSLYLGCLGLEAGAHIMETIMGNSGLLWIGLGFVITVVPTLIMIWLAMRVWKADYATAAGMACGAMANPMALNYATSTLPGDDSAVAYATVYPLSMFARVILTQLLVLLFV